MKVNNLLVENEKRFSTLLTLIKKQAMISLQGMADPNTSNDIIAENG